jgi:RNA polymerase sigma factor (sigma-70 family)
VENPPNEDAAADAGFAAMLRGMRRGDEAAWEDFHRRYYLALLRVAAARSHDPEAAIQAVYLRVARHIRSFRSEPDLWRWLCCLVRCVSIDQQRERTRTSRLLERFHLWLELWRSRHEPPSRPDLADTLDECLRALGPEDATLLRRKYCEGWSTAELARENSCSEKSIESRLARLRAELRARLAEIRRHE